MTERYWITGAQIGVLLAFIGVGQLTKAKETLDYIMEKQFIGNMREPYEDYKIIIVKK